MAQGIVLDESSVLEVRIEDGCYHVVYGFHRFAWFDCKDQAAKRVVSVQLANMGVGKTRIAEAFDVNRSMLYRWMNVYEQEGIEALVLLRKGRRPKINESIKDYIRMLSDKLQGRRRYKSTIVEEVKKAYGVQISQETIRRVMNERPEALQGGKDRGEKQEPGGGGDSAQAAGEKPVVVKHGGALLSFAFLQRYGIESILFKGAEACGGRYGFKECVFSLLLLLAPRLLRVEEHIKHYDVQIMGGLIGREKLPSVKTLRKVMAEGCERAAEHVEWMKSEYARRCLAAWEYRGPFYLDGHFMPYSGGEQLLYGYNPHKRLAQKGRTAYVVNTGEGRPIYEVLSDGFDDFKANIEKIVDFLREEAGISRPTVIFDRGGFGWESFERIEEKADFICWYQGEASVPKGRWKTVWVPHQGNTYGEAELVRHEIKQEVRCEGQPDGRGHRRMVFIRKGAKVSPAITNMKQAEAEEVALMLTRRWGAQENVFKELVIDGYDQMHSYRKDEYEAQYFERERVEENREMENPQWRKVTQEKRKLKAKRNVILGRMAAREKEKGKPVKATKQQQARIKRIDKQLAEIAERLEYLPEKILRTDYIDDNGVVRLSNEKKKYFDLLNLVAYNLRRDMVEMIGPIYRDNRDVHQLVLKILRLMTRIEYEDSDTRIVFMETLKGKEMEALLELCRRATDVEHRAPFFPGKLSFTVQ